MKGEFIQLVPVINSSASGKLSPPLSERTGSSILAISNPGEVTVEDGGRQGSRRIKRFHVNDWTEVSRMCMFLFVS
jgi:hypothetical protein